MSDTAADLLDRASTLWLESRAARRDAMLEVGRLLHAFLVRRLAELADGATPTLRGLTPRSTALREACGRLRITEEHFRELVQTSQSAVLVTRDWPAGTSLGCLSYTAVRHLRSAAVRVGDTEEYALRMGCEWVSGALSQAVRERWTEARVAREIRRRITTPTALPPATLVLPRPDTDHDGQTAAHRDSEWLRVATLASPPDLADLLLDLVRRSSDPDAVRRMLLERLGTVTTRREVLIMA